MLRNQTSRGFTLIEMVVVMTIAAVSLGVASVFFASYVSQGAARRAAQVFSRDLAQARSFAARSREAVVIRFDEDSLSYRVASAGGRELVARSFARGAEIPLSAVNLELSGDSLHFDPQGLAALPGLGAAAFTAGDNVYEVRFNATGSSRVLPR